jgi:hypothetical protein
MKVEFTNACVQESDFPKQQEEELVRIIGSAAACIEEGREYTPQAAVVQVGEPVEGIYEPVLKHQKENIAIQFSEFTSPEQKLAAITYMMEKLISDRD